MQACHQATNGETIALDGKTARGSYDKGKDKVAIHMVSAFTTANELLLEQIQTYDKSNEITAMPELLDLLEVCRYLITIDAMEYQRKVTAHILLAKSQFQGFSQRLYWAVEVFEEILPVKYEQLQRKTDKKSVDKDADYLLAVKGNQGKLHDAFENNFSIENSESMER